MADVAAIRQKLSKVPGVSRTWFEWDWDSQQEALVKALIVEVSFDTDPNSSKFNKFALDEIERTARGASTTMSVTNLRIVPADRR